jgi:hypothetical protein
MNNKRVIVICLLSIMPVMIAIGFSSFLHSSFLSDFLKNGQFGVPAPKQRLVDSIAAENNIEQSSQIHLNKGVVYTIEGKKDPRLQATFLATYISTSKSAACSRQNSTTATRKVNIGSKRYPITEEHYRIEIPIYLEENENQCGYRFSRIELVLRRLYDEDLYSRHILLENKTKVDPIYYGDKTGIRGGGETL